MTIEATGSCLCGAVMIEAKQLSNLMGACHCSMCRQWGGGPFFALDGQQDIVIKGSENISLFASSEWAERAFCSTCGTHLFYRFKQTNQHMLSAGLFGFDSELEFDHQIFIDDKPSYYCFADETQNLTGAEVIAAFSGE
jgi:hypothetical protein